MKKILIFIILLCSISGNLFAENVSSSGLQFLNLGIGARAIAMGDANIVSNNDASMIYWNPANLALLDSNKLLFMHGELFADMKYDWISYAMPTKFGGIGIGIQNVDYGTLDKYDEAGTADGNFSPNDKMLIVSGGYLLGSLDFGASFKYIKSVIIKEATAYSCDFAVNYEVFEFTKLGFVAKNYLSSDIKYRTKSDPLPKSLEFGLGYSGINNIVVETNIKQIKDEDVHYFVGFEYALMGYDSANDLAVFLRAGYNTLTKDSSGVGISGISMGFGIKYQVANNIYKIDYSYKSMGDLGMNHVVSLGVEF